MCCRTYHGLAQAPDGPRYVDWQGYRLCTPKNYDVAQENPPERALSEGFGINSSITPGLRLHTDQT